MDEQEESQLGAVEVLDLLPSYVLGILDSDEKLAVDETLRAHPELRTHVRETEAAVGQLALAAPHAPLRKEVAAQVLRRARASIGAPVGPLAPSTTPAEFTSTATTPAPEAPARPILGSDVRPVRDSRQRGRQRNRISLGQWLRERRYANWALLGMLTLAMLLVIVFLRARMVIGEVGQMVVQRDQYIQQLQGENEQVQQQMQRQNGQIAALTVAPLRIILEPGASAPPTAGAALFVSGNLGIISAFGLPALPETQNYQLWLIPAQGAAVSAGLLRMNREGLILNTVEIPAGAADFAAVGVSVEPAGGSPEPAGSVLLLGNRP
jgi:anti-sigma-K factor RskA